MYMYMHYKNHVRTLTSTPREHQHLLQYQQHGREAVVRDEHDSGPAYRVGIDALACKDALAHRNTTQPNDTRSLPVVT
jgi:hypothetical protein